ncbi:hypothetical protein HZS_3457, partial [Henneguya salminicola]
FNFIKLKYFIIIVKMNNDDYMDDGNLLSDYFLHVGFNERDRKNLSFTKISDEAMSTKILPICEIELLKNESPSPGFICPENKLKSNVFTIFNKTNLNIAIKRSSTFPPLIGIELVKDNAVLPSNYKIIYTTPSGEDACLYTAYDRDPYYIACVFGTQQNKMALVDITFMKITKSDDIPHTYSAIQKSIRQTPFDPEMIIIYRRAKIKRPLCSYRGEILSRYPIEDIRAAYPIPLNVTYFCLPQGGIIDFTLETKLPEPGFICFSLTTGNGCKVYGTCMIYYYEIMDLQLKTEIMTSMDKDNIQPNVKYFCNQSLCILSRFPMFRSYQLYLKKLYDLFISKQHCGYSYEKIVSHFISSIPCMHINRSYIRYNFFQTNISFELNSIDQIYDKNEGSLIFLFEFLPIKSIVEIFFALLIERKIMIHAYHPSLIMNISEALINIIFPFSWQCPYIPLCPLQLCNIIQAPLPFICGISTQYFDTQIPPIDVICVDLNNKRITGLQHNKVENNTIHYLPQKSKSILLNKLENIYSNMKKDNILNEQKRILKMSQENIHIITLKVIDCLVPYSHDNSEQLYICKVFDKNRFLSKKPIKERTFFTALMNTQLFTGFIENCTFNFNQENIFNKISFFDNCIEKISKHEKLFDFSPNLIISDSILDIFFPPLNDKKHKNTSFSYSYSKFKFPTLDKDLLKIEYDHWNSNQNKYQNIDHGQMYLVRNPIEKQKMLKFCANQSTIPNAWAKYLLVQIISCWFMSIPIILTQLGKFQHSHSALCVVVQIALAKIRQLVSMGCDFKNEVRYLKNMNEKIFIRILINLCREYKLSKLALKILVFLQDIGINIDSISYGVYHNILISNATTRTNIHRKRWIKLINVIETCFYLKTLAEAKYIVDPYQDISDIKNESYMSFRRLNISTELHTEDNSVSSHANCITKNLLAFKMMDLTNMAQDFMLQLQTIKNSNYNIFDRELSIISYSQINEINHKFIEIFMNSCNECQNCNRYLYDEQILAGFSINDTSHFTRCSYCMHSQSCKIYINIKEYKRQQSDFVELSEHLFFYKNLKNLVCIPLLTFSVTYYSPLVLRTEMEKVVQVHGTAYMETQDFFNIHQILFWNLIWYFKRLSLFSSYSYLLPNFLNLPLSTKFLIICSWENPDIDSQNNRPLSFLYKSPLSGKQFEESIEFVKKIVNPSLKAVRVGNMTVFINHLVDFRHQCNDINSKKWHLIFKLIIRSLYWETLFLILACSNKKVNLEKFDNQYQAQLNILVSNKFLTLNENDKLPSERTLNIRKLFGPLNLIGPAEWVQTYII